MWHFVQAPVPATPYTLPDHGTALCGGPELTRAAGDVLDYTAHPRIGERCDECEEKRIDMWADWLNDGDEA